LHKNYNCVLEMGGDDQWSNMLAGVELIRRKDQKPAFCITCKLLTTSDGRKMGKTEKGALWLDAEKCSPYDFYQYWRNVDDADVMKCIRMLTFLPLETIEEMDHWDDSSINEKKKILAFELTTLVHGEEEARKAEATAAALFSGAGSDENMPTTELSESDVPENGLLLPDLMVRCGLCPSKSGARRLIQQGGVTINGETVSDENTLITRSQLQDGVKIRRGKKVYHRAILA
ncbi:MAG: tyrosine--tRNA ligase, partial [Clostridia bacterium]|nr:tyrosine--tRNA ligase [Clostridia bacterium]